MIKLDMKNKICPYPVIETKKALKSANENQTIKIMVDNIIATENLEKMAIELGYKDGFNIDKISDNEYYVFIVKGQGSELPSSDDVDKKKKDTRTNSDKNSIIAISSDTMGDGDIELSKKLIEGFIYSLTEHEDNLLPTHIIFYNKGVFLTTIHKKTIDDLIILQKKGVKILSCGLCLDFYNVKDNLAVGEVTNMYNISKLMLASNTVNIG